MKISVQLKAYCKKTHLQGFEPWRQAPEACMIPLHHRCYLMTGINLSLIKSMQGYVMKYLLIRLKNRHRP